MMIPCQLLTFSEFICSAFQFQCLITEKISKCMKNNKWSQKGLKIDDVALNGAFWTQKKYGVQISSKKMKSLLKQTSFHMKPWYFERDSPFCTRSASNFCRNPLYFLARAMCVKWLYHANFWTFSEFISNAFQFHGLIAQNNQ